MYAILGKDTLRAAQVELPLREGIKDDLQMPAMLSKWRTIDQDIIKENRNEFAEKQFEQIVHHHLKMWTMHCRVRTT